MSNAGNILFVFGIPQTITIGAVWYRTRLRRESCVPMKWLLVILAFIELSITAAWLASIAFLQYSGSIHLGILGALGGASLIAAIMARPHTTSAEGRALL